MSSEGVRVSDVIAWHEQEAEAFDIKSDFEGVRAAAEAEAARHREYASVLRGLQEERDRFLKALELISLLNAEWIDPDELAGIARHALSPEQPSVSSEEPKNNG